jgi:phosphoglucosamine mutase
MTKLPQKMTNVRVEKNFDPTSNTAIQNAVRKADELFSGTGRVLLRASGTEPVVRVMAEGADHVLVDSIVKDLVEVVKASVR